MPQLEGKYQMEERVVVAVSNQTETKTLDLSCPPGIKQALVRLNNCKQNIELT